MSFYRDIEEFEELIGVTIDSDVLPYSYAIEGHTEEPTLEQDRRRMEAIIEECVHSRVFFVSVVLGAEPDKWQRDVLEALDNGETKITIRSGVGVGKTTLCAWIALHFLLFRNDVKIPVTSPSSSQLKDGLIPETAKWMGRLPPFLREMLIATSDRIERRDSPKNNFISFRTARKETPEALAGIHAKSILAIVDEASGVHETVYEAAQGVLSTEGAIFVLISNPTRLSGFFYKTHHTLDEWRRFHVSGFDSKRVDKKFIKSVKDTYGENSYQYTVRVLGNFPEKEEEGLISKVDALAAVKRDIAPSRGPAFWGVDVGRGGDPSALVKRRGNTVFYAERFSDRDLMQIVGRVANAYFETPDKDKPEHIFIDSIGIGAGVADRLRELGLPAIDVNVSESASMKGRYVRLRDELWFALKEWLESQKVVISIENDDDVGTITEALIGEMTAILQLYPSSGKNQVESKSQMLSRGIRSPNIADALIMTFAYEGAIGAGALHSAHSAWNKPLVYETPSLF